nr:hypothetical protein [uncultured Undibacterium sp.]
MQTSGFNIIMSGSHGESIEKLVRQTLVFLHEHRMDMLLLKSMKFKISTIDFGLYDLSTEDRPWPSYRLPASLIAIAGELGFEIVLSFYGPP